MSTYQQFKYAPVVFTPQQAQLDPVGKIRVSNPETLIDTDFEYGLQATKWETLELVNNIPFAFARQGDPDIPVANVNITQDSDVVRVITEQDHNFTTGTPFRISGLRTVAISSEGVGLVTRVINTTSFEYKARKINLVDASVETINTELVPGAFYAASHFKLNELRRIYTDGGSPTSNVTVEFNNPHGFIVNTAFYIVNSVTGRGVGFSPNLYDGTSDGVDFRDTTNVVATVANGVVRIPDAQSDDEADTIVPYIWTSAQEDTIRLNSSDFNVSTDVFEFSFEHNYGNNTPVLVVPPIDWLVEVRPGSNATYGATIAEAGNWVTTNGRFYTMKYVRPINTTAFRLYPNTTASAGQYTNFTKTPSDYGNNFLIIPCFPVVSCTAGSERVNIDTARLPKYANNTTRQLPQVGEEIIFCTSSSGVNATVDTRTYNRHTRGFGSGTGISYAPFQVRAVTSSYIVPETLTGGTVNIRNNTVSGNARRDNNFTAVVRSDAVDVYDSFHYTAHGFVNNDVVLVSYNSANIYALAMNAYYTSATSIRHNDYYYAQTIDADRFRLTTNTGAIVQVYRQPKDVNVTFTAIRSNETANRVIINNHGFAEGTTIVYNSNSGSSIGGLTTGTTYYVHRPTVNTFILSTSEDGYSSNPYTKSFTLTTATVSLTSAWMRNNHAFSNGDIVQVTGDDLPSPLANGQYYHLRTNVSSSLTQYFRLYYTEDDAINNTNRIEYLDVGSGTITLRRSDIVDMTSASNDAFDHAFTVTSAGAADGVYNVSDIPDPNTMVIETNSSYDPKIIVVNAVDDMSPNSQSIYEPSHQLVTAGRLTYFLEDGGSLVENTDYYKPRIVAYPQSSTDGFALGSEVSGAFPGTAGGGNNNIKIFANTTTEIDSALEHNRLYYWQTVTSPSNLLHLYETAADLAANNPITLNGDGPASCNTDLYINVSGKYKFDGVANSFADEIGNNDVYAVVASKHNFRLATTEERAKDLNFENIFLAHNHYPEVYGNGHTFTSNSIAGEVVAQGTVTVANGSAIVNGSATTFSSYFREGDKFRVYLPQQTLAGDARTSNTTNVVIASDLIRMTASNNLKLLTNELSWGDGTNGSFKPQRAYFTSTGVAPGGLEENKLYYYRRWDSADTRALLYNTYIDCIQNTNIIDITSVGTGTYTWYMVTEEMTVEETIDSISGFFTLNLENEIDVTNTFINPNYGDIGGYTDVFTSADLSNLEFIITTSLLARTEGLVLHRPHDGGVEMLPALSPDSRLTRQTRRYFRYQSGKGFQMSMAVNFNAPTEIRTFNMVGYYVYDFTINDAGSGYTNGEFIEITSPPFNNQAGGYQTLTENSSEVKFPASAIIETDGSGAITKIAITNTGCNYWTSNLSFKVIDENGANSSGVNANLTVGSIRGSAKITSMVPHRLSQGLAISTIDSNRDGANNDYFNTQTEVFQVETTAPQEEIFYTNTKGEGATLANAVIIAPGSSYDNNDLIAFSSGNATVNASATVVTDAGGAITGINISNTGTGYLQIPDIFITNSTGGSANGTGGTLQALMSFSNAIPSDSKATGFHQFYVREWANSRLRAGMFDDQNGLFYEFDGQDLYAVRRSSVKQLSGSANVTFQKTLVTGNDTQFVSQLQEGDFIVLRGQSYKVSSILSETAMHVSPPYRGITSEEVTISLTVDTRIKQSNFSIDPVVGTGVTGYNLDINKIQMVYIDYAWYGAGKARFGFKDAEGEVVYVHEFIHNNQLTESYFRSGNLPARYEVANIGQPDYVPALTHWGTSVIMDGKFDEDEAYLFTAAGSTITFTGSGSLTTTGRVENTNQIRYTDLGRTLRETDTSLYNEIRFNYYVKGDNYAAVDEVSSGTPITGGTLLDETTTTLTPFQYPDSPSEAVIPINRRPSSTTAANTNFSFGSANASLLVGKSQPLVSMRLGPSVDNSNIGALGVREIINRMQLRLKSVGVVTTHDIEVQLILNGQLNNTAWERLAGTPSLSQYIPHSINDVVTGGIPIFQFLVPGGPLSGSIKTTNFYTEDITDILALGNSILGGNDVFPNGPDVLTIAAKVQDFSNISTTSPLTMAARISWSESQA